MMARNCFATLILLLAATSTPASATPASSLAAVAPNRQLTILEYRERLAEAVAQLRPSATIMRVNERTLKILEEGRDETQINIENGFNSYLADPAALDSIVARYAKLSIAMDATGESVDQLVIIVRPSDYLISSGLTKAGPDKANKLIAPRPMAGDLSFFLAVDSPETIRTASTDDLERWRLDEASAWDRAASNIRSRMGGIAMGPLEDQPDSATAIGAESGLAPSLLADPVSCSLKHPKGNGRQVVLVVSRNAYIFGVPSDRDSMRRFWGTAKALTRAPAPFSATPLTCDNGRWKAIAVP